MTLRLALLSILLTFPGFAQETSGERVVAGLNQNRVSITANFDGSEIVIFGAVGREAPPPDAGPLEVIVAISGPSEPLMVRRKARKYGIWVNTDSAVVEGAPSLYAVATSNPFGHILSDEEDREHRISIPRATRPTGAGNADDYAEALIRIRREEGLYYMQEGSVDVREETLFNTSISLPANLTEGIYIARIFLTRDQEVIDEFKTVLYVSKVGLERWIFNLAHEQPLIYGFLSLFIAIAAGWGASAAFRYIRT